MRNNLLLISAIGVIGALVYDREQKPEVVVPVVETVVDVVPIGSDEPIEEPEPEVEQSEDEPAPIVQRGHWEYRRVGLLRRKRVWVNE